MKLKAEKQKREEEERKRRIAAGEDPSDVHEEEQPKTRMDRLRMIMAAKLQQDIDKRIEEEKERQRVKPKVLVQQQNIFSRIQQKTGDALDSIKPLRKKKQDS